MTERKLSHWVAAFNARPFGMPIPPNWFGLAAFGMLGAMVDPGFWLIGAGLELLYLWGLTRSERFLAVVDATSKASGSDWKSTYQSLSARLDERALRTQAAMEQQGADLTNILTQSGAVPTQLADVRQMVWMHLKLLAARAALLQVIETVTRDRSAMLDQQQQIEGRLQASSVDDDLRHSLEQQLAVIQSRHEALSDANKRCEIVDAEIERLRQQMALVREQALLATDEDSVARSVDALSASLNEANHWLKDQRELLGGLYSANDEPPPPEILRSSSASGRKSKKRELER
jgi:hypothetical protein